MFFIQDTENDIQPVMRGTMTSFGSEADGKVVKSGSTTLQGTVNGSSWTTLASDTYRVRRKTGYIEKREVDDNGDVVDWSTYFDYQDLGNQAFRVTYTVKNGATENTYTNESITISESDPYVPYSTGGVDGEVAQNLVVDEIHARYGEVGGWLLSATTLSADSGGFIIDSSVPSIAMGSATAFGTGTGIWEGKDSGTYKWRIGNPAGSYMSWNGSALAIVGASLTLSAGDVVGGWTIGASPDRLYNDTGVEATSAGMSPSDYPFYAGAQYANRATAPFRVYYDGTVYATKYFEVGSGQLTFDSAGDNLMWTKGLNLGRLDVSTTGSFNLDTQGYSWVRLTGTAAAKTISYIKKPATLAGQFLIIKNDAAPVTVTKTSKLVLKNNQGSPPANYAAMSLYGGDIILKSFGTIGLIYDSANERWTVAFGVRATRKNGSVLESDYADNTIQTAVPATTGTIQAQSGEVIITKSAGFLAAECIIGTDNLEVVSPEDDSWLFATNDIVYLKNGSDATYLTVTQSSLGDDTQVYTYTVLSGTNPATYPSGTGIIDYGASGAGFLKQQVSSGLPYYSVFTHSGTPSSPTEKARMGSLTGITDAQFGALSGYGLWTDNVYLTGSIKATAGLIGGWTIGTATITADSGNVTLNSTTPYIGLGATAYGTGTGFWVGKDSGSYKLRIGDATNNQMRWDGTNLTAGGFTIGADYIKDAADSFGLASTVSGSDDVRFWAGDTFANRATSPFQVYESGLIFAKDVILAKGALTGASGATGYGYAVDPLFMCHFDGTPPIQTDFRGSAIGHKGQLDTRSGGVIFPLGKFGKAVQVAEGTTNYVLNPSAETTGNFVLRGTATVTRDTVTYLFDATSYKVVIAAANDGIDLTTTALPNAIHMVSFWATGSNIATLQVSMDGSTWNTVAQLSSESFGGNTWTWCNFAVPAAQCNGSTTLRIRNTASSGTFYIDGVQAETNSNYPTPYCDGGLGGSTGTTVVNGHSWNGTADASYSVRAAASLSYAGSGNFNYKEGTVSFWYYERGYSHGGFPTAVDIYYGASDYLRIHLGGYGGGLQPYGNSTWGGAGGDAAYAQAGVTGGWHHLAFTWSASNNAVRIYIDGVVGNTTGTYSPSTPAGVPTIYIGANNDGSNSMNTKIDDFAILPVALTANEVKSVYYSSAPLMLGVTNQEFRLSGAGLGDVWGNAYGLFGRNSSGTPSFMLVNGSINATVVGGASETLDTGDLLLGDNNSSKANMFYDASAGKLNFRGGTTVKAYIDTTGAVAFGGGNGKLDTDGISLTSQSGSTDKVKWFYSGTTLAGSVYTYQDAGVSAYTKGFFLVSGTESVNYPNAILTLKADKYDSSWSSVIELDAKTNSEIRVSTGKFLINDTADTDLTKGITINQGANDDNIISLKSSDVAHGVTNTVETDTYGYFKKAAAAAGGLWIGGVAENATVQAIIFHGVGDTTTTKTTGGTGVFEFRAYENNSTATAAAMTANSNLLVVRSNTTTRFILDADGDSHQDVGTAWTNFDTHDDAALLNLLSAHVTRHDDPIREDFGSWLGENRDVLESLELVSFEEPEHPFVNMSRLSMLLVGAVRQQNEKIKQLENTVGKLLHE